MRGAACSTRCELGEDAALFFSDLQLRQLEFVIELDDFLGSTNTVAPEALVP